MSKWQTIREWINRDNGKMYQIGNKKLGPLETVAYFLIVVAMLVYVLHSKTGLRQTWVGWVSLLAGVSFLAWSAAKAAKKPDNS